MATCQTGIYRITNIVNNNIYIGSSIHYGNRKRQHLWSLRKGGHPNKHLQASFNKHGEHNFVFELIEICLPECLISKEQYYIDLFNPQYNKRLIADSNVGVKHGAMKDYHKDKIRRAHMILNRKQVQEVRAMSNKGIPNIEISKVFKIDPSCISRMVNGRRYGLQESGPINRNIRPKLTKDVIVEIYNSLRTGCSSKSIEKKYDIDQSTVSRIRNAKRNYKWLEAVK